MIRSDIIVTCDVCDCSKYEQTRLDNGNLRYDRNGWFDGDRFLWKRVGKRDVCPGCRGTIQRAATLGITAAELE